MFLRCFTCDAKYGNEPTLYSCRKCDNPLEVVYEDAEFDRAITFEGRGVWRYQPILPIRNIVVFPGTVMPLNVGRPKSKAVLDEVVA